MKNSLLVLLRSLGTLGLLALVFPLNLAIVAVALIWNGMSSLFKKQKIIGNPQNILLTGGKMTKALQLARSFHEAGHHVTLIETHKLLFLSYFFIFYVSYNLIK